MASNGNYPDVEITYVDQPVYVDPLIVTRDLDMSVIDAGSPNWARVAGIPVHLCWGCEPGRVYVVDRPQVVDEDGLCLVCGEETTS